MNTVGLSRFGLRFKSFLQLLIPFYCLYGTVGCIVWLIPMSWEQTNHIFGIFLVASCIYGFAATWRFEGIIGIGVLGAVSFAYLIDFTITLREHAIISWKIVPVMLTTILLWICFWYESRA